MQDHIVEIDPDRSLHFVTDGSGPDLILIHGAFATGHDWSKGVRRLLVPHARVIVIDRPGHGGSRRPRFCASPREQSRHIREALTRAGVERPLLIGHSLGGLVAMSYAEQFPSATAGLVRVAPLAFGEPRPLEHSLYAPRAVPIVGPLISALAAATTDPLILRQLHRMMFDPDPVPAFWQDDYPFDRVLDPDNLVAEGEDFAALLPFSPGSVVNPASISAPTHILVGSADRIVDEHRHARGLAAIIPGSRLTLVAGAGHMLHHSHPELVVEAAVALLSSPDPTAAPDSG